MDNSCHKPDQQILHRFVIEVVTKAQAGNDAPNDLQIFENTKENKEIQVRDAYSSSSSSSTRRL